MIRQQTNRGCETVSLQDLQSQAYAGIGHPFASRCPVSHRLPLGWLVGPPAATGAQQPLTAYHPTWQPIHEFPSEWPAAPTRSQTAFHRDVPTARATLACHHEFTMRAGITEVGIASGLNRRGLNSSRSDHRTNWPVAGFRRLTTTRGCGPTCSRYVGPASSCRDGRSESSPCGSRLTWTI